MSASRLRLLAACPVVFGAILAVQLSATQPATAQEAGRPELLNRLTACRALGDSAARLACYDSAVEALDVAEREGDVVMVDRAQVRESRRALFGFSLPSLPAFGRVEDAEARITSIETTLERASRGGDNKWVFRLADGSAWRQIDSGSVNFQNRNGTSVRVRQASLGSYMLVLDGSRAVRVRREQ